jgi:predicted nucleic acid-binding protein
MSVALLQCFKEEHRRRGFVAALALTAVLLDALGMIKVCRDPDDDNVLEIAVVGCADCLVSGNEDLESLLRNTLSQAQLVAKMPMDSRPTVHRSRCAL